MEELLEQLMEEATASSLKGKLNAETTKQDIDVMCDMLTAQMNIVLNLKASKSAMEKQVESLSTQVESYKGLELSYHTDIEILSKQIEGLKAINEAKAREIEGLERTISILTGKLQESESTRSSLALSLMDLEGKLSDKDIEIDKVQAAWQDLYFKEGSYAAEVAYYKQQAKKAEETSAGLREEIESLRAQQTQDSDEDKDSHIKVKYTKNQKDRMAEVYKQTFRNKTKTMEILHQEGIDVSYRHLIRILQKRGFKSERKK